MSEYNIGDINNLSNQFGSNVAFVITGAEDLLLWCKSYKLPGISMTPDNIPQTPYAVKLPSADFSFGDMDLDFFVDEDYTNFQNIITWMMKFYDGSWTLEDDVVSANLFLFNNQMTSVVMRTEFTELFPIGFNGFDFGNVKMDETITMNISFAYNRWRIRV